LPVRGPDLDLPILQSEKLLLLVKEYECLWGLEAFDHLYFVGEGVVDFEFFVFGLDHDFFVELLQKLNFVLHLGELELEDLSAGVDVEEGHGDLVLVKLQLVQKQHDSVADLELSNGVILQNILKLVGAERPDSVGLFDAVFGDDLAVNLVELYEVWPAKAEVSEKLLPLELSRQQLSMFLGLESLVESFFY